MKEISVRCSHLQISRPKLFSFFELNDNPSSLLQFIYGFFFNVNVKLILNTHARHYLFLTIMRSWLNYFILKAKQCVVSAINHKQMVNFQPSSMLVKNFQCYIAYILVIYLFVRFCDFKMVNFFTVSFFNSAWYLFLIPVKPISHA